MWARGRATTSFVSLTVVAASSEPGRHDPASPGAIVWCQDVSVCGTTVESTVHGTFFDPDTALRGVYRGEHCDLVYDIRPVPANPDI